MFHFSNDLIVSISFLFHKISGWARSCASTIYFNSKYQDSKNALEATKSYKKYSNIFRYLKYILYEWFALEMNQDHSVVFETAPKYCVLDSFVDYKGYFVSSEGFLPTAVDIMVI